ncbi:tRNA pseudouridine synthase B [Clostridium acidisoli DSM 12555]|jgi:tRNA pseudouridine55 synthase|uniref:tRNA pseudouridine synthase B n=1 Tax=Clostridium acidisoli DSM 12555 TaxID=1121291 RepID=A0A1W1XCW7_9CLOT|nr:tRNA pseudouridine(55) synthase TruB [Clostridium acidisoli]SMC21702.1 tRNA pseudouridine synthase B [Clostridium acidisoli DSM 12555]
MDGIINIYKPEGISSFDVVRNIRKLSGIKKVGHTGTLDPMAKGVLPICLGKSTKIVDYIMKDFKIYKAVLKLGEVSDTYDREGKIIQSSKVDVDENEIISVINSFIGEIDQVPPMYSALKVNGKRLYELARQGIEIERQSRKINIYDIIIEEINIPYVTFEVKCSKGTYIRSLCYDIGEKLNCGALMWDLERVATGKFTKENAIRLEDLSTDNLEKNLIPMDKALHMYDKIYFEEDAEKLLVNGVNIKDKTFIADIKTDIIYRVYLKNDKFIGLGMKNEFGFKIIKLLLV